MNDKRHDFLWIVQTLMLKYGAEVGGFMGTAGDAIAASYRIPSDMTARQAALSFSEFAFDNLQDAVLRTEGMRRECPAWLLGLSDPS